MRIGFHLSVAALVCGVAAGGAMAQTSPTPAVQNPSGSDGWTVAPGGVSGSPYEKNGITPGSAMAPEWLSDGTLAETASTTALATSTYHQPTGFLPGMKP